MTHRVFIAFPVSALVTTEAARVQDELTRLNPKAHVTWVRPELMHVTVRFLGETEEASCQEIDTMLKETVPQFRAFDYWLDGLTGFPTARRPNVVVARVAEERRMGHALAAEIDRHLSRRGHEVPTTEWKPHLTIGRNKSHDHLTGLTTVKVEPISWNVDRVQFIESTLGAGGPTYHVRGTYFLGS